MTVVSNDPSWWPQIILSLFYSYWSAATGIVVIYDWVLTLGQEIELIWRHTANMTTISMTDAECNIMNYVTNVTNVVVAAMLGVIMIARLHAMYQGSRMILVFLVIIFLVVNIACVVITLIGLDYVVGEHSLLGKPEEVIISGTYICNYDVEGDAQLFASMTWMLNTVWEVLALCLAVWIAVKHFRDLQRLGPSTGSTIGDCFMVLITSHVLYFASSARASFNSQSMGVQILHSALQILSVVQMFVLGPRLILSVREYHAKLVAQSDADISMSSIVFEERVHVPTSSTV
ncbi:hypothetical protein BD769DRAFT_1393814 [Suillus cothurnatus]|nr:hypothetical protein BD769DRAFT_1393814 [Suillus cothurnatus]